ncbi:hypothetical protein BHE74_00030542 [Ensete ventricosum]|nr:hypothetical protein BHE74_00030542 [Ensete ventricosum]
MEAALPERQREGELRSCRGDGREGSGLGRSASNRKVLRDNIQGITNQARHPPWRRQAHLGGSFTRRPRGELKIFLENAILDGVTYTDHWLSLPWTILSSIQIRKALLVWFNVDDSGPNW